MHDLKSHYNKILLGEYMKNQFVISFIFLLIGSPLLAGGNGGGGGVRPNNKPAKISKKVKFISSIAGIGGGGGGGGI